MNARSEATMNTTTENGMAKLAFDADTGVATLLLEMEGRANKINDDFAVTLQQALAWANAREGLRGIILGTGHKDFCVGADIDRLYAERDVASLMERLRQLHGLYRSIETSKVPVVAALTGSALGGGYELALCCHHLIAVDDARIQFGLPEVSLGVIPGAGGTQRLPRRVGIQAALELIAQGKIVRAPKAKAAGLVDALAPDRSALMAAARQFIADHPKVKQPWDAGKPIPGPQSGSNDARNLFMAACGMLVKKTARAYPAPELAISAVQEGLAVEFDRALEIESRYFTKLATSDQAKDMIRTVWYHRTAAEKHEGLPRTEDMAIEKIGILGAGMMGAGLAFISAKAGFDVVLRDIDQDVLDKAMQHARAEAGKLRHLDRGAQAKILERIAPTLQVEGLHGCDLIIEAVFENLALKHRVTQEAEPKLSARGIWASNTSALPIGDLARVSADPTKFIGMHFFSPVEKMQLLEVITTAQTSDATLARALAYARKIKKLPIVVGDGYGFYTTRVFSAYILEGAQLVAEGHDPVLVEWAARKSGMVVPPLQVSDEVTLSLMVKGFAMGREYGNALEIPGVALVEKMVLVQERPGRAARKGFYDYDDKGRRVGIWPGLRDLVASKPTESSVDLLSKRLLGLQALEAARCVAEGVVKHRRDAEVGAIFGIGFAPNTGGPLSYIDRRGPTAFVQEMDGFAERYGDRYRPPQLLRDMATRGETFFEPV
jgi:3-hydroxyacyl-CoA dehydrogenase/enoyl-CoA hydratase/3-hydroxybutyryl-CoA epimerase